ncbi:ATP-binding cassette domain-containing protein [Alcanivorax sp. VBW004]|uniref:ABC transporter ATP-binding protein n=1 Tax=unclassified Alcanivorax TaxID=2638842 RepID=UPI00017EC107|nr:MULTISPECIES: ABC transporter ATP-binding protein [unclassified Alcanivorax]EDX90109.1 ABC transporter, ATP-binding protein [Alcanivorax sp. DG881]MTT52761.1 ATP-binding cassette domain-containing protein [Alcanivorax sp. VBW004]
MSALTIRNLTKTYANGVQALKGIDLEVKKGDFFALLGPNGAGKSTTIGVISSLVNKTGGDVSIFGYSLDTQRSLAKKQIGVVPQEFNFNQFEKVFDIVVTQAGFYGIPAPLARERAEKYLRQLGLWDKRDKQSRTLSGGMKRRLMIARALVHEPELLILDEPTAGVDIELRRSMWDFLTRLNEQGKTIILTTHYLEEAESLCRHIAIIDHGMIAENTDMKSLLEQLQVETFVLDLARPVTEAPQLEGFEVWLRDAKTLEVAVPKSESLNTLFVELARLNFEVMSMRNKANRLEELFVRLVEQNLPGEQAS